jgi:tetratricopeptide (TPR) repeat protein
MTSYFSAGLATAYLQESRYNDAVRWFLRATGENPQAVWMNHLLAAAYAFAGRPEEARRSLFNWTRVYPDATIGDIKSGLPFHSRLVEHIAEGLESAGLRYRS